MGNLFDELIEKIFLLLPFKSVVRCLCLSKFWNGIIRSSLFRKMYLRKSIDANINRCLVLGTINPLPTRFYKLEFDDNDNIIGHMRPIPGPIPDQLMQTKIVGHINGVICVCNDAPATQLHGDLALWDPSIHKVKKAPNMPASMITAQPAHMIKSRPTYGFAYKSTTDDFEIIQIHQFHNPKDNTFTCEAVLWCARLNVWRRIPEDFFTMNNRVQIVCRLPFTFAIDCPFLNGHLHWPMYKLFNKSWAILAFDIENEVFLEVGLPAAASAVPFSGCRLSSLGDHLYLLHHLPVDTVNVWRMNEYSNGDSWVRLYSLRHPRIHSLYAVLLSKTDRGILNLWNSSRSQPCLSWVIMERAALQPLVGFIEHEKSYQVTSFVESFQLADGDPVPEL